jgi:hypothetical protein
MSTATQRTCPNCGNEFSGTIEFCPVCMLRRVLLMGLSPASLLLPRIRPGPQEGWLREPSLQALLRELAAFNKGLCVITTRTPVADLPHHERTLALRRNLEQLSSDAGAKRLQPRRATLRFCQKNQTLPMSVYLALMSMEEASARGLVDEPLEI